MIKIKEEDMTKIICISDTHNQHEKLEISECDILIHSGDASINGTKEEMLDFFNWFNIQPAKYKVYVPGNHDIYIEEHQDYEDIAILINKQVSIYGINIYGAPWRSRPKRIVSEERVKFDGFSVLYTKIKEEWDKIPDEVDVLITHVPPYGYLDKSEKDRRGCENLANKVINVKMRYHIFGHIHSGYGIYRLEDRVLINAALCNGEDVLTKTPIILNYETGNITN